MTRGGVRKGAGRPEKEGEKKTTHLGGVHVTPTQLESYRRAARLADMSITDWVVFQLDKAALRVADLTEYVDDE